MNFWYNVMDKELRMDDENTFSNPRVNTSGTFHNRYNSLTFLAQIILKFS